MSCLGNRDRYTVRVAFCNPGLCCTRLQTLDWCLVVGFQGQMQSTAAAANSQWGFQTPVDVNTSMATGTQSSAHSYGSCALQYLLQAAGAGAGRHYSKMILLDSRLTSATHLVNADTMVHRLQTAGNAVRF